MADIDGDGRRDLFAGSYDSKSDLRQRRPTHATPPDPDLFDFERPPSDHIADAGLDTPWWKPLRASPETDDGGNMS